MTFTENCEVKVKLQRKIPTLLTKFTYWAFLVDGLDDKPFVIEGDVPDLTPGEANLWCQPKEKMTIDVLQLFQQFSLNK